MTPSRFKGIWRLLPNIARKKAYVITSTVEISKIREASDCFFDESSAVSVPDDFSSSFVLSRFSSYNFWTGSDECYAVYLVERAGEIHG